MASPFGKFLWPIVVPTGGYTIAFSDAGGAKTANVAAGTQTSILGFLSALKTAMDGASAVNFTCAVTALGIVSISGDASWTWTEGSTTAGLKTLLGLAGTEQTAHVGSNYILTATSQHTHGYYPGLLTYGYTTTDGNGVSDDTDWQPEWPVVEAIAGDGTSCVVGPDSPTYVRTLTFGKINQTEYRNATIGLLGFWNSCIASQFRYYEDREDGTVASPGTQNTDYYLCKIRRDGVQVDVDKTGEWRCSFSVRMNKEPTP